MHFSQFVYGSPASSCNNSWIEKRCDVLAAILLPRLRCAIDSLLGLRAWSIDRFHSAVVSRDVQYTAGSKKLPALFISHPTNTGQYCTYPSTAPPGPSPLDKAMSCHGMSSMTPIIQYLWPLTDIPNDVASRSFQWLDVLFLHQANFYFYRHSKILP
jgi:hypothetical protein